MILNSLIDAAFKGIVEWSKAVADKIIDNLSNIQNYISNIIQHSIPIISSVVLKCLGDFEE
jgi:hypothetical protein